MFKDILMIIGFAFVFLLVKLGFHIKESYDMKNCEIVYIQYGWTHNNNIYKCEKK